MSIAFASKISALRREKNITQKNAAESLGISQALLSHYEKGIRECNLDFVKKAAIFYDVSADYLLGLSEAKHGNRDIFDEADLPSDTQIQTTTLFRAFVYLMTKSEEDGAAAEELFNSHFSLSMKKFIERNNAERKNHFALCDMASASLSGSLPDNLLRSDSERPQCLTTVDSFATELIKNTVNKTIKR